jgi:ligand-binding SRPBCC domain-containing protein
MSRVHYVVSVQKLPLSLEKTWEFFSNPHNLLTITPPFLNLKVINEVFGEEVCAGQIISYKVKPLFGIAMSWTTEITHLEKQKMFVDEQRKGPYKLWHHQHHFKSIEGGTQMTDIVHYRLPFGIVGEMAHSIIKRKIVEIFTYRFDRVNELFGKWPDQKLSLKIG